MIDKWIEKVKKLRKLLKEIAKLLIELVSIVGWDTDSDRTFQVNSKSS